MTALLLLACLPPPLEPVEGLLIEQLHLPASSLGEATLVLAPDGSSMLIDVGNDSHGDELREALWLRTGQERVDRVLLTHLDADHVGGLDEIDFDQLIFRGEVDLDEADPGELRELQELLGQRSVTSLCSSAGCELPFTLELGEGATLELFAANGELAGGASVEPGEKENERSLVGTITQGPFTYLFGGDAEDRLEDLVAAELSEELVAAGQVDLLHLNHHGKSSSTTQAWVERFLPEDGQRRHAVVGANRIYGSAPDEEVLERIGERLHGGSIWVTEAGTLADPHPDRQDLGGSLALQVLEGGDSYRLSSLEDGVERELVPEQASTR